MQIAISNFKVSHKKVFTNSNKLFKIWKILTSLKDIASAVTALLHTLMQYIEMVYSYEGIAGGCFGFCSKVEKIEFYNLAPSLTYAHLAV